MLSVGAPHFADLWREPLRTMAVRQLEPDAAFRAGKTYDIEKGRQGAEGPGKAVLGRHGGQWAGQRLQVAAN